MKLEVEKFYKTRVGTKAKVLFISTEGFFIVKHYASIHAMKHTEDGYLYPQGKDHRWDLISEWDEKCTTP